MVAEAPSVFEQIYRVVRCIPPGRVATYGQVARMAGMPRGARTVGWAMHSLPEGTDVPWHRVIHARGTVHGPPGSHGALLQRLLLEEEGIVFDEQGRIDLELYGWCGLDWTERPGR